MTGTLFVLVEDKSRNVVENAEVHLTYLDNRVTEFAKSNPVGEVEFKDFCLARGFQLDVEVAGFAQYCKVVQDGISPAIRKPFVIVELELADSTEVIDLTKE